MTEQAPQETKLPSLERVLVIGSGGRENSLAWAVRKDPKIQTVFVAPGNGGTETFSNCIRVKIKESSTLEIICFCHEQKIDLIIIGAEIPLATGLADQLRKEGLIVFGPNQDGAQLEASKDWAKELMKMNGVPTAKYWTVNNKEAAFSIVEKVNCPLVVKANGLAAGKGVSVCNSLQETKNAINDLLNGKFGQAGSTLILEEKMTGPEVSIFALCDGEDMVVLPSAQDHKRLLENDQGVNTGGMGAYAPAALIKEDDINLIKQKILKPTLKALKERNINYRGVIYAGLMLTTSGFKVIEFNCRFGDPECQTLMPLMGNEFARVLQACALGRLNCAPKLFLKNTISSCVVASAQGYPENPKKGDKIILNCNQSSIGQIFHAGTEINHENDLITSGGRVLSVVSQGDTYDEAFNKTYKLLKEIKFEGMYYRKDIGRQVRKEFKN